MTKFKTPVGLLLPSLAILAVSPLQAADPEPAAKAETEAVTLAGMTLAVEVTPKLYYFDFTKGWADGGADNHFFHQYDVMESLTSDNGNGFFADADVDLMLSDDKRVITLQREGFGIRNHRNKATIDDERIGGEAHYSRFTSASYGLDYQPEGYSTVCDTDINVCAPWPPIPLYSLDNPNRVPNQVERTTRGASLTLKPTLMADWLSAKISFDGYERKGHRYSTFYTGGEHGLPLDIADITFRPSSGNFIIDETADTLGLGLASSLRGLFDVAYDMSVEKFGNRSSENPKPLLPLPTAWQWTDSSDLLYIPDTTLITHGLRVNKQFGDRAGVAAGYSRSHLEQDSNFIRDGREVALPDGSIQTTNAYITGDVRVLDNLSFEGHAKASLRDNHLDFATGQIVVEELNSREYGLSGTYRLGLWNSSATLGWNQLSRKRDFTGADTGILFRDETRNNEVYVKLSARPMKGLSLQLTPSVYLDSSKTAYATEPESGYSVKARANYTAANGMTVGAYFDRKHIKNNDVTMTEVGDLSDNETVNHHVESTQQSLGATFSYMPTEKVSTTAHVFWNQTDGETYYLSASRDYLRFDWEDILTGIDYLGLFDLLQQKINVYGLSLAADWRQSDKLTLRGNYSYTRADGDTAKSLMQGTVDPTAAIDHGIHALTFGADYAFNAQTMLKSYYTYEYLNDKIYPDVEGGLHTLMVGVTLKF